MTSFSVSTPTLASLALGGLLCATALSPAFAWSLKEAAEPYKGTEIHILDEVTPLQESFAKLVPEFEAESGIKVNYQLLNHFEVINRGQADLLSGRGEYDAVMNHGLQYGLLLDAGVLMPIDDFMKDPKLADPDLDLADLIEPAYSSLANYGGKTYSFLQWNYNMVYWGRKDLFENKDEQAAFEAKYGYPLKPAETFQQVHDIAEFFTRKSGETLAGKPLTSDFYGIVMEGLNGGTTYVSVWEVFIRNMGGKLFDEAGHPTFDTPEVVKGLTTWSDLWKYAPPGQAEYSLIDVPTVMGNGIAAQSIAYSDFVLGIDQPGSSSLAGSFLYGPTPRSADEGDAYFSAGEPSGLTISAHSKNPEATYLFLQWAIEKSTQEKFLSSGVGVPMRNSSWPLLIKDDNRLANLYEAMQGSMKGITATLKMPRFFEVSDVMNRIFQQVGLGKVTPEDAAKQLQQEVSAICDPCVLQ
ncbi:Maltose-binding periplasmic protein [Hartmannibacter diazotrophicus]|uniref:Maltose-binding periplasmic protein n=1 Tax=Hartmannibacter diazotrophicus TaxID=1482074 RepID=A0A2C9D692_9HYPH|nr:extracellular solute-binding protein [Hartmannibacter diazotrophicus]SON55689.1 Maltose-binding periplasmic protein [Hartmannibacter diazotrophicus]